MHYYTLYFFTLGIFFGMFLFCFILSNLIGYSINKSSAAFLNHRLKEVVKSHKFPQWNS